MTTSTIRSDALRAQLEQHYGLSCIPRWGTMRNFDHKTLGGRVARIAAMFGTPFMPWQRYVADVALEIDPYTGLFVYRGVDLLVPRQSGKTSLMLPVAVHRGMAWQKQRIIYGAQTGTAAREKWEDDQLPLLNDSPLKGKYRVRRANGREAIIWLATRSIHGLTTNAEKASHGKTLHLALLDEYFAQVDYRQDGAVGPAMITVPMAQKWRFSTAGTSKSVPLNAMRKVGREAIEDGRPTTIAFFDWTAADGADRADPATWRSCMPALCPAPVRGVCRCSRVWRHTVVESAIAAELESKSESLADFDRPYLNITREDDEVDVDPNVPPIEAWNLLANALAPGGPIVAGAIDITPLRDHAAISIAGEGPDGLVRLVCIEHAPGTEWLLRKILEIHGKLGPVAWVLDEKSQANTLIQALAQENIHRMGTEPARGHLWIPTVSEYSAACGDLAARIVAGRVVHPGQDALTAALLGARTRPLGDGSWGWGRKVGAADISPLVAHTLALAGYEKFKHLGRKANLLDTVL